MQARHTKEGPEKQGHHTAPSCSPKETTRKLRRASFNMSMFLSLYFSFSVWFLFLLIWVRVLGSCVLWFRKCSSLMPALDGRDFLVPLRLNLVMWLCVLIGCQEAGCKQSLETCLHHGSGSFCTSSMAMRSGCLFIQKGWKTPGADLDATHILKSWRAWITWKPANLQMLLWD